MPEVTQQPVVAPVAKPVVAPAVKHEPLTYAKPGNDPAKPTNINLDSVPTVNGVPQTSLPHLPNNSYLMNGIR